METAILKCYNFLTSGYVAPLNCFTCTKQSHYCSIVLNGFFSWNANCTMSRHVLVISESSHRVLFVSQRWFAALVILLWRYMQGPISAEWVQVYLTFRYLYQIFKFEGYFTTYSNNDPVYFNCDRFRYNKEKWNQMLSSLLHVILSSLMELRLKWSLILSGWYTRRTWCSWSSDWEPFQLHRQL